MCLAKGCECKCLVVSGIDEERDEVYYDGVKCDYCSDNYPDEEDNPIIDDLISLVLENVQGCENPNCQPHIEHYVYPKGHPDIKNYPEFEGKTVEDLLKHKIEELLK